MAETPPPKTKQLYSLCSHIMWSSGPDPEILVWRRATTTRSGNSAASKVGPFAKIEVSANAGISATKAMPLLNNTIPGKVENSMDAQWCVSFGARDIGHTVVAEQYIKNLGTSDAVEFDEEF